VFTGESWEKYKRVNIKRTKFKVQFIIITNILSLKTEFKIKTVNDIG
jgi:hypothetical protein